MVSKTARVRRSRTRTIYLPSVLKDSVYSALQRSIQDSTDEDLVVDTTHVGVMDSRLVAMLRAAMSALKADHHSLTVVKAVGGRATPMTLAVSDLGGESPAAGG
jgi:anti-anti-sigma regulatory factor